MKRNLITSALAVIVFTVLLGLVYPLVVTGISQVAFGKNADGNPDLIAKAWTKPSWTTAAEEGRRRQRVTEPDPRTSSRGRRRRTTTPTARSSPTAGPTRPARGSSTATSSPPTSTLNGPYNPGLTNAKVPADAVTTSGSGVDPHISVDNARIQARRVAQVRGIPLARVNQLVDDNTDGRFLGLLGEPGVNTTKLNEALGR